MHKSTVPGRARLTLKQVQQKKKIPSYTWKLYPHIYKKIGPLRCYQHFKNRSSVKVKGKDSTHKKNVRNRHAQPVLRLHVVQEINVTNFLLYKLVQFYIIHMYNLNYYWSHLYLFL